MSFIQKSSNDKDKALGYIENLITSTKKISHTVKGLQAFARDGSHDAFELVTVTSILKEALNLCRQRFEYKNIKLYIPEVSEDLKISVQKNQIVQVLLNLLNNAYDAIVDQDSPWIEIKVLENPNDITISVIDSGVGLSDEAKEKLMQPFYTTKEIGKGTGLGLSIALGIMQQHYGTIKLNEDHSHTCFTISFPKKK